MALFDRLVFHHTSCAPARDAIDGDQYSIVTSAGHYKLLRDYKYREPGIVSGSYQLQIFSNCQQVKFTIHSRKVYVYVQKECNPYGIECSVCDEIWILSADNAVIAKYTCPLLPDKVRYLSVHNNKLWFVCAQYHSYSESNCYIFCFDFASQVQQLICKLESCQLYNFIDMKLIVDPIQHLIYYQDILQNIVIDARTLAWRLQSLPIYQILECSYFDQQSFLWCTRPGLHEIHLLNQEYQVVQVYKYLLRISNVRAFYYNGHNFYYDAQSCKMYISHEESTHVIGPLYGATFYPGCNLAHKFIQLFESFLLCRSVDRSLIQLPNELIFLILNLVYLDSDYWLEEIS